MSLLSWFKDLQQNFPLEKVSDVSHITSLGESIFAALCYIPPFSAIALVWRGKDSLFVSFHAKQALLLEMVGFVLVVISPALLKQVFGIILLLLICLGIVFSLRKQKWYMPVLSNIADSIEI
jgi:uncharacterized membrane protein